MKKIMSALLVLACLCCVVSANVLTQQKIGNDEINFVSTGNGYCDYISPDGQYSEYYINQESEEIGMNDNINSFGYVADNVSQTGRMDTMEMKIGDSRRISDIMYFYAGYSPLQYSSTNTNVAYVDSYSGLIYAVNQGSAVITVLGDNYKYQVNVCVYGLGSGGTGFGGNPGASTFETKERQPFIGIYSPCFSEDIFNYNPDYTHEVSIKPLFEIK